MNYHGEPYRATRLWLEAVAIFRKEVPLGKHRRQWKSYDECFIAQDAITWFTKELQQKFEPSVTRKQTLQLLQKFYKSGIFASVNNSNTSNTSSPSADLNCSIAKESDFKDNGHLYRLVIWNPKGKDDSCKGKSSGAENSGPTSTLQRKIPKYDVLINQLSNEQVYSIWEQAFIDRLANIIGLDVVRAFFKPHIIKGCWISHNLTQLGKYGVVLPTPSSQKDDLPSWLVSAMKCLANWPNHHTADPGMPNYPNFERDVFKLICEYFSIYKEGVPLLTFDLYDAFIMSFIRAELFDFNSRLYSAKVRGPTEKEPPRSSTLPRFFNHFPTGPYQPPGGLTPRVYPGFIREESYPFNASESVENLIMDILTPNAGGRSRSRSLGNPKRKSIIPKRIDMGLSPSANSDGSANALPKPMNENSYSISRYFPETPRSPFFYETAFTIGSPITRVLSKTELKSSFATLPKPVSKVAIRPSTIPQVPVPSSSEPSASYAYENPVLELSASDMINHPKYIRVLNADMKCLGSPSELCSSYSFEMPGNGTLPKRNGISADPSGQVEHNAKEEPNFLTRISRPYTRSQSATHLSDMGTDRSPYFPDQSSRLGLRGAQALAMAEYSNSSPPSKDAHRTLDFYYGVDACIPGLMTNAGKQMAIQSFRLLTLLLPPTSRRHLQLLLRCMSKMAKNEKLKLDADRMKPTRAIVINTFFRCIMYCSEDVEFDELLALRIVTFMMDNDSEIFCIKEEEGMARCVQELISAQQIVKVPAEEVAVLKEAENKTQHEPQEVFAKSEEALTENKENVQYCNRISLNEYEGQKLLGQTSKSLRNLLDTIIHNPDMEDKDRKKRLGQFKEEYPHIFYEKFGDEPCSFLSESNASKSSVKKEKERKPFRLFRTLRF